MLLVGISAIKLSSWLLYTTENISILFPYFLPKPSLLARFLDESVFVALEFFDALGAGTFPLIHGVHLVPCVEELLLLAAEAVLVIAVRHIKRSPGDLAFGSCRRFKTAPVHLGFTGAKGRLGRRQF